MTSHIVCRTYTYMAILLLYIEDGDKFLLKLMSPPSNMALFGYYGLHIYMRTYILCIAFFASVVYVHVRICTFLPE